MPKTRYYLNNREVEIVDIHLAKYSEDSIIEQAHYIDSGEELTDSELEKLTDKYAYELSEQAKRDLHHMRHYDY
jgi:hypothetical protein